MTLTQSLRAWLGEFEGLAGDRIRCDCLGENLNEYSLDSDPAFSVKRYLDGTRQITRTFVFSSKEAWGMDIVENEEILAWYDDLERYVDQRNRRKDLPKSIEHEQVLSVAITSAPYPFAVYEDGKARYQITLQVTTIKT